MAKKENTLLWIIGIAAGYFLFFNKSAINGIGVVKFLRVKFPGMKKEDSFTVYPYNGDDTILIQSSTRIGRVNLRSGETLLSKSRSGGARVLSTDLGAAYVMLPPDKLIELQQFLWENSGNQNFRNVMQWENKELFSK